MDIWMDGWMKNWEQIVLQGSQRECELIGWREEMNFHAWWNIILPLVSSHLRSYTIIGTKNTWKEGSI
jgi:hypothetical protein